MSTPFESTSLEQPDVTQDGALADSPVDRVNAVTPLFPVQPEEVVILAEVRSSHQDVQRMFLAINPINRAKGVVGVIGSQIRRNRALGDMRSSVTSGEPTREPTIETLTYNGHEHLFVVTQPDPEAIDKVDEATIAWFKPGLSETADAGSAKRLHMGYALQNPDQLVITEATKGISQSGKKASLFDLSGRRLDVMAAESLHFVRHFAGDGDRETELYGVSLGTVSEAKMLAINVAANPKDQLNINTAYLIASAVMACEVDRNEDFRDPNFNENDYRKTMKERFRNHIVPDLLQMAVNNPAEIIASRDNVGAYLFAPEKALHRLIAIKKDYKDVGQGMSWSTLKDIVRGTDLRILGGSEDPLIQEQIPQWIKMNELVKRRGTPKRDAVIQRTVPGYGHLISANISTTLNELAELKKQTHSTPIAA